MQTNRRLAAFVAVASLAAAACTLLLDRTDTQCATDGDCKHFSAAAVCNAGICVNGTAADGGLPDSGFPDSGIDSGLGPPGCFAGTPTTDIEFYNACTTAQSMPFDNCGRLGVCADAGMPDVVQPPPVEAGAPPPLGTAPTDICYDAVARPNVIFMNGSTNFTSFIKAMAPVVAPSGYTIVWQPTSSCTGADTVFNQDPTKRIMKNPTNGSQSWASYYNTASPGGSPCLLGYSPNAPTQGVSENVDVSESDVFATSCPQTSTASPFSEYVAGQGNYANVGEYLGPAQPMVFAVPSNSSQRVISAEAAHLVFGTGGGSMYVDGGVTPWTDPAFMWIRSPTTGTNNILARGISVPSTGWWGIDKKTATGMVSAILAAPTLDSEKIIGTLSMDVAEPNKNNLHMLYFQAQGQLAGFLPDLTPFSHDKENVRDGHYPLWGPVHLYTQLSGGNLSPEAAAFITPFVVPEPAQSLLDAEIATGNVPLCAMKVTRTTEMGPLSSYAAPFQCHCYYEFKVNGGNNCQTCTGPATCPASRPACNLGYCEVQ